MQPSLAMHNLQDDDITHVSCEYCMFDPMFSWGLKPHMHVLQIVSKSIIDVCNIIQKCNTPINLKPPCLE